MGSRKSKTKDKLLRAPRRTRPKSHRRLIIAACTAMAIGASLLLLHKYTTESDPKPAIPTSDLSSQSSAHAPASEHPQKLVGRWLRPDGGYVIDIRKVETNGELQAAYFNPRPIHVSKARVTRKDEKPHIFIELRDAGYPGATYALTYHKEQDLLTGVYFQPAVGQSFDVVFIRMK